MRDELFGDINDYHKYGLLRMLTPQGKFKTGVCWMRRPDEGSAEGYLGKPKRWQNIDCDLFKALRRILAPKRDIRQAERPEILPRKTFRFFRDYISDDKVERGRYFNRMLKKFQRVKLIFFDPDNGLEVKSKPPGRKGSSKYLCLAEVHKAFESGKSLLIFQFIPPVAPGPFIAEKRKQIRMNTGAHAIHAFKTPRVVFFLAVQPKHSEYFECRIQELERSLWHAEKRIVIWRDEGDRR